MENLEKIDSLKKKTNIFEDSSEATIASQEMSLQIVKFAGQVITFEFTSGKSEVIERSEAEE